MYCRTVCFLITLLGSSSCILGKHGNFKDELRTYGIKEGKRLKRGIALVDEDFDIPPAANNGANEYGGIFNEPDFEVKPEGSGDDKELLNKEATDSFVSHFDAEYDYYTTKDSISEPLQETSVYIGVTNKTTNAESFLKESEYTKDELQTTGSKIPKRETTSKLEVTKKKVPESDTSYSMLVSSGDGIYSTSEYSSNEITEQISIIEDSSYEEVSDDCLKTSCDVSNLTVEISADTNLIPEGTNISLECRVNISHHQTLYWYQSNGTAYFLQTFGKKQELTFYIPDSRTTHSGKYKCCVKKAEECCNIEIHLTVYKIPLYKYHLIVLALISAVGLLLCIFLGVRQSRTLKVYTKDFIQKHGDKTQQLLWN